jgi:hypothetical protein
MRLKTVYIALLTITFLFLGLIVLLFSSQQVRAYPEFASRTGETCGTCHVNPAGAGPRTQQGELWVLDDKPDIVVGLPDSDIETTQVVEDIVITEAGDDTLTLGGELYEIFACDSCHGIDGEGSTEAPALNIEVFSPEVIVQTIRTGPEEMPAIPERMLADERMDAMVTYVQHLASGRIIRVEVLDALGPIFDDETNPNNDDDDEGGS